MEFKLDVGDCGGEYGLQLCLRRWRWVPGMCDESGKFGCFTEVT